MKTGNLLCVHPEMRKEKEVFTKVWENEDTQHLFFFFFLEKPSEKIMNRKVLEREGKQCL